MFCLYMGSIVYKCKKNLNKNKNIRFGLYHFPIIREREHILHVTDHAVKSQHNTGVAHYTCRTTAELKPDATELYRPMPGSGSPCFASPRGHDVHKYYNLDPVCIHEWKLTKFMGSHIYTDEKEHVHVCVPVLASLQVISKCVCFL